VAGSTAYPAAFDTDAVLLRPDSWFDDTDAGNDTLTVAGVPHQVGSLTQYLQDTGARLKALQQELGLDPSASFSTVRARLDAMTTVRKTADQTNATITPANVTDLVFPTVIGADYSYRFLIPFSSSLATAGIGLSVTTPAVTGYSNYIVRIPRINDTAGTAPATPPEQVGFGTASNDEVVSDAVGTINVLYMAVIEGVLSNPSAAGSIQVRFRAEVAATITVKKGAHGVLWTN
jgi:hypothetical protein